MELVQKGFLSEADALLDSHVVNGNARVLERLEWIKISSLMGEHAEALNRLRAAKDIERGVDWSELETELLIRSRSFSAAADLIESLRSTRSAPRLLETQEGIIRSLVAVQSKFAETDMLQSNYSAYCINLDEQAQKWKRCEVEGRQAGLSLTRVPGLNGSCLPRRLVSRFGKAVDANARGTLGCFVSHVHVWERVVDSGAEIALVLEDDFRPRVRFPKDFKSFGLPNDFDVCWISERMAISETGDLRFNKVEDIAIAKTSNTSAIQVYHWAVGTEGYLVSKRGAQKLLESVAEDGLFGDVDARMLAYSISAETKAKLSIHSAARLLVDEHWKILKARKPLRAFGASIGLVSLVGTGSDRKQHNSSR